MKSTPKTNDFQKFREFVRGIMNVPGSEVKREIEKERSERQKKKRAKTSPADRASHAKD
jgi:hypothetical protein